jgi:hypothetical protein
MSHTADEDRKKILQEEEEASKNEVGLVGLEKVFLFFFCFFFFCFSSDRLLYRWKKPPIYGTNWAIISTPSCP